MVLIVLGTRDGEAIDEEGTNVDAGRGRALNCFFNSSSFGSATAATRLPDESLKALGCVTFRGDMLGEDPSEEGAMRALPNGNLLLTSIVFGTAFLCTFSALRTLERTERNRFGWFGGDLLPDLKFGIGLA